MHCIPESLQLLHIVMTLHVCLQLPLASNTESRCKQAKLIPTLLITSIAKTNASIPSPSSCVQVVKWLDTFEQTVNVAGELTTHRRKRTQWLLQQALEARALASLRHSCVVRDAAAHATARLATDDAGVLNAADEIMQLYWREQCEAVHTPACA